MAHTAAFGSLVLNPGTFTGLGQRGVAEAAVANRFAVVAGGLQNLY